MVLVDEHHDVDEQQLLDSFRSEIQEIATECHEKMQHILTELKHDVQRELQWRREQQQQNALQRRETIEWELLSDDDDKDEPDGEEEDYMQELIQLDIFSDLRQAENLETGVEDEMVEEDFVVGDTEYDEEVVVDAKKKVDNHASIVVDEEKVEMMDVSVPESGLESKEEDAFVDLHHNDADRKFVKSGSIAVKTKAPKRNKKRHNKEQSAIRKIHSNAAVDIGGLADEKLQSEIVADGDESATLSSEDWKSYRSSSKKKEKQKGYKSKRKENSMSMENDDGENSLEAIVTTKTPNKFVRRSELIMRPLIFAMISLLAAIVIHTVFDLVLHSIRHFGLL